MTEHVKEPGFNLFYAVIPICNITSVKVDAAATVVYSSPTRVVWKKRDHNQGKIFVPGTAHTMAAQLDSMRSATVPSTSRLS